LIPTPIEESSPLEPVAFKVLLHAFENERERSVFAVEDAKPARRRWLRYCLPREAIEDFVYFNEHTQKELAPQLVEQMKQGKRVYLMSDAGLPGFCDPGRNLIDLAHQAKLNVTLTPFANSSLAALVLSGFESGPFVFQGFLPKKGEAREKALELMAQTHSTQVIMETPYRLGAFLKELGRHKELQERRLCLALDINTPDEQIIRSDARTLEREFAGQKRAFVLVIDQISRGS
jgi:16S rRNA (cytidine1402-2'-O)-methyltransferase